jgi:hypothetical protein
LDEEDSMTDPNDTDTTKTTADGELPETALDAVTGGATREVDMGTTIRVVVSLGPPDD